MPTKDPNKKENTVFLEGYLRENNLKKDTALDGDERIQGFLTIAISENDSYRVFVSVQKHMKSGDERKEYAKLEELLPENTMTIASYLKATPDANWEVAKNQASKVYMICRFEEYVTVDENGAESSMATLRGIRGGFKTVEGSPFRARATFNVDLYIEDKKYELTDSGSKTGRLLIVGLLPDYKGMMHRITFIAEDEQIVAYVDKNYSISQTANFEGDLRTLVIKDEKPADEGEENVGWGSAAKRGSRSTSTFVKERIITGGAPGYPINSNAIGGITAREVKYGLVLRQEAIEKASERRAKKKVAGTQKNGRGLGSPSSGFGTAKSVQKAPATTPASVGASDFNFDSDEDF